MYSIKFGFFNFFIETMYVRPYKNNFFEQKHEPFFQPIVFVRCLVECHLVYSLSIGDHGVMVVTEGGFGL